MKNDSAQSGNGSHTVHESLHNFFGTSIIGEFHSENKNESKIQRVTFHSLSEESQILVVIHGLIYYVLYFSLKSNNLLQSKSKLHETWHDTNLEASFEGAIRMIQMDYQHQLCKIYRK